MSAPLRRRRPPRSRRILRALLGAERAEREVGLDQLAGSAWERPALLAAIRRLEDAGLLVRGPVEVELDDGAVVGRRRLALTAAGRAAALALAGPSTAEPRTAPRAAYSSGTRRASQSSRLQNFISLRPSWLARKA